MKKLLLLTIATAPFFGISQIQIGQDIDGEYNSISGCSVSISSNAIVAVGARRDDGNGVDAGHVRVYENQGGSWVQVGQDIDGEAAHDRSGYSVSLSSNGSVVAIGGVSNDGNGVDAGHVRVYENQGGNWVQVGQDIDGETANDWSGESVSLSSNGTIVAIGASWNDGNGADAGHVRVYENQGGSWVQVGQDIDGEAANDESGYSVSLSSDGSIVAVGAWRNDGNGADAGHVRVYENQGGSWVQVGQDMDGEVAGDYSGYSVSLSSDGSIIAIGALNNSGNGVDAGHVRVYENQGGSWVQVGQDIDGEAAYDEFGYSVSLSSNGSVVAIGGVRNDGNGTDAGHVRVYVNLGGNWVQVGQDIDGEEWGDHFGHSVSISPDGLVIAIGAPNNNGNGTGAGHVKVYSLSGVYANIYNDFNQNCMRDNNEFGVVDGVKGVITPGDIIVETNEKGQWYIDSLPSGTYTITYDTSGSWQSNCPNPHTFSITNPDSLYVIPSFGMYNTNPCSEPNVSVNMSFIRPCFSNQKVYVQACNSSLATGVLSNGYVDIELDSLIMPTSASLAYTSQGDNTYRFMMPGSIYPGQCVNFTINTTVSCDAVLGQTLCMEANLYPVDSCVLDTVAAPTPPDFAPCALPWDKSSISVEGWCENDSIYFTITNTGDVGGGDMQCYSPIRLYIDGQYILLDSIQLVGQNTDTLVFSGDGRTWRLEVDQHPLHPGNSHPNATVELCGNDTNWTPDIVNILPLDDADPITDIYCGIVTGSYDPNDKTGYPLGVTDSHFVSPNGKMDYVIRFQNTGSDTAFTVVIRDTLDTDLNIFSVNEGVSSHNYDFKMYGPRVLEWTFNDIMLPDSNVDLEGSNGFVTFTVNQAPDLADYTKITNSAGIYFDFNAPIITNQTSHFIKSAVKQKSWSIENQIVDTSCTDYSFNSITYTQSGSYFNISNDTLYSLQLVISNNLEVTALVSDSIICEGDTIVFNGSGALTYTWNNGVINGQPFTPSLSQLYTVVGLDTNGCENIDSVYIEVYDTIPQAEFSYQLIGFEISMQDSSSTDVNSWLWFIGEDSISNTTIGEYEFTQDGMYDICLIASNDCFSDTICKQIIISGVGIEHHLNEGSIKVYPNPTISQLTFNIEDINLTHIRIVDITGKTWDYTTNSNSNQFSLSVEDLNTGMYFYELRNKDDIIGVGQFIKK